MKFTSISILTCLMISSTFSQSEKQTNHNFQKEIKKTISVNYLLYLPREYTDRDTLFPLVLFLHGSGERGNDLEKVKIHGLPMLIEEGKDFPFIVVSPQCPENMFWDNDVLSGLLDEIQSSFRVDTNRIYVTGLSLGGNGTWSLALAEPNRFAAIAPVCGWSVPSAACTLKDLPIWTFHGDKDNVVPFSSSELMVNRLKACDGNVKFTVYKNGNHNAWTETYNNEELYTWLLNHSLDKNK